VVAVLPAFSGAPPIELVGAWRNELVVGEICNQLTSDLA
jgi:hypothetical protein